MRKITNRLLVLTTLLLLSACSPLPLVNISSPDWQQNKTANIKFQPAGDISLSVNQPQIGVEEPRPVVIFFYGGNPEQIFVMGHSAGTHIAALLHYDERYLSKVGAHQPCGLVGLAGPYDFLPLLGNELNSIFPAATHYDSQPVHFIDGTEGPALLLHGLRDNTVKPRNSAKLAQLVAQAGGSASLKIYEDETHADVLLSMARSFSYKNPALEDAVRFINNTLCAATKPQ